MLDRAQLKNRVDLFFQFIRNVHFFCIPSARKRAAYIKKKKLFAECGEELQWVPRKLPSDPKCIRIHNNVKISSEVMFITHDIIYDMLNHTGDGRHYKQKLECIEIMDNVMIGLGAKIMPGVRIGPNAIIGAGSVVSKDVAPGTVVAGVPAKVIGSFDAVREKQYQQSQKIEIDDRFDQRRINQAWDDFAFKHNDRPEDVRHEL